MEFNDKSKEILKDLLKAYSYLAYVGVDIIKDNKDYDCTEVWFTVPAKSELFPEDNKILEGCNLNTSEGLVAVAKQIFYDLIESVLISECDDDEEKEEMKKYFRSNASKYIRLYYKIRERDIWTKEKGQEAMDKAISEIRDATGYKEA